jgi:hypothetical protein
VATIALDSPLRGAAARDSGDQAGDAVTEELDQDLQVRARALRSLLSKSNTGRTLELTAYLNDSLRHSVKPAPDTFPGSASACVQPGSLARVGTPMRLLRWTVPMLSASEAGSADRQLNLAEYASLFRLRAAANAAEVPTAYRPQRGRSVRCRSRANDNPLCQGT